MRLLHNINRLADLAAAVFLAVATLAVALQVSVRFLLDNFDVMISAPWTEEICRYSMIWAIFLGAAVLCREGRLIAVDVLLHKLPVRSALAVDCAAMAVAAVFFVSFGYLGFDMARDGLRETSPVLQIPMAFVYAAVPVGSALSIVNILALTKDRIVHPGARHATAYED